jgi:hypothetical protein
MLPRAYGVLLRQRGWVKKAGASSRTPYGGSKAQAFGSAGDARPLSAQGFGAAYERVAGFVEAEEAVDISCDSDADADANSPRRSRCGAEPERALCAQV